MSIDTHACPHSDIVVSTERNLALLTRDVDRLVKSQAQLLEIQKDWAVQQNENAHTKETIKRAFGQIEKIDEKTDAMEATVENISMEMERIKASARVVGLAAKHWPLIIGLAAAAYAGLELLGKLT